VHLLRLVVLLVLDAVRLSSLIDRCSQNKGRPLPKFGEWDVKNPATADGFTVIFQKARDNKKTTGPGQSGIPPAFRNANGNGYGYGNGNGSQFKSGNSYPYSRVASPKRVKVPTLPTDMRPW
jgi:hypothetical protein